MNHDNSALFGLSSEVYKKAKAIYENRRWSHISTSKNPLISIKSWESAGLKVRKRSRFDVALQNAQDILENRAESPRILFVHRECPGYNHLVGIGKLADGDICVIRANLSVLIAQRLA